MESVTLDKNAGGILKRIRERLNISELDIMRESTSGDLIKLVESGKIPLNSDNARIVCQIINNILDKRNIDIIIEPEDLFNPLRYEAKEKAEVYISELDKHRRDKNYVIDPDDLDDFEMLLNEYDLMDKKLKAYKLIGDIYYTSRDYEKEYEYLSKAWELTTRYPKRKLNYIVGVNLASNHIDREKYQGAITLYEKLLLNFDDIPQDCLGYLYYNYALAYSRLKMYSFSLEMLSVALKYVERKDYDLWRKAYNLQGVCYCEMGDYESALSSYNKALQVWTFAGYNDAKYVIYSNIAEVYTKLNDENIAHKYLDVVLKDIDKLDKNLESYIITCNQLGISYENLGEFRKAEKYYKESLEYSKKNFQRNYITKNILALVKLNTKIKVENIFEIIEEYIDGIIYYGIKFDNGLSVLFNCLKTYVDNKEYKRLDNLINTLIKY